MAGGLLLVLPVLLGVALVVLAVVWAVHNGRSGAAGRSLLVTAGTAICVVALAVLAGTSAGHGLTLALLPASLATAAVLVVALVERTWPRPSGALRIATLRTDAAPPRALTALAVVGGSCTVALVTVGGLTADADGRGLTQSTSTGSAGAGPYPGWFYGVPVLLGCLALVGTAVWASRLVSARPAQPGVDGDSTYRLVAQTRIRKATGAGLLATASGLGLTTGRAWSSTTRSLLDASALAPGVELDGPAHPWLVGVGTALEWGALALLVAAAVAVCWRLPRAPRQAAATEPVPA